MIRGKVTASRDAVVDVAVGGAIHPPQPVQAVIDTGYNGTLTLPNHLIASLQLPFVGHRRGVLADGSSVVLDVYLAAVMWHGKKRDVLVLKADGAPLIGMSLLKGSRLTISVIDAGDVVIEEIT